MQPCVRGGGVAVVLVASSAILAGPAAAATCASLTGLALSNTTITLAQSFPGGTFTAPDGEVFGGMPAFCRVAARLTPSSDSHILVELWMPSTGWNGRYEGTGNGGYAGSIVYSVLADGVGRGNAVANTDMGTSPATVLDGSALVGHPERWKDWGYRATHVMTVAAKQIIRSFYGRQASASYFSGCSTGGEQALMEAQRYPDDYDGIVGGDPGNNRTHLHTSFVWTYRVTNLDPAGNIPLSKLPMVTNAVLAQCGGRDGGLASDGFLADPRDCGFNPKMLLCKAGDAPNCLTAAQADALAKAYDGPRNPSNRHLIYPGWPRGSEDIPFGLPFLEGALIPLSEPAFDGLFKWVFGANWDWRSFDFDHDMAKVDAVLAPILNAMNPDLSRFKRHGGKLILFHGTADWIVAPQDTINYYNMVVSEQQDEAGPGDRGRALEETQDFARLFLAPGMAHCGGGPGPNVFNGADNPGGRQDPGHDVLSALVEWVEQGVAPDQIIATKFVNDNPAAGIAMTRPLCPYPQFAVYRGTGDPDDAGSFVCRTDDRDRNEVPSPEYLK